MAEKRTIGNDPATYQRRGVRAPDAKPEQFSADADLAWHDIDDSGYASFLPPGVKVERVEEPPYLSDELVEQIAVLHNGGTWPDDYKESHRQHWRGQAVKIIELVRKYLENPMYKVTPMQAFINDHLGEPYDPTADDDYVLTPEQIAAADKSWDALKPTKWTANEVSFVAVPPDPNCQINPVDRGAGNDANVLATADPAGFGGA